MAGRSKYGEADKAQVFVCLTANNGNVKRTSRDTGVPEQTVRNWKFDWEENPPNFTEEIEKAADSFVADAERVRAKALAEIERKLPEGKIGELNAVVGTLSDKVHAIRGIASARIEHQLTLPSPDDLRKALIPAVQAAIEAAEKRQEEIIDAEVVEEQRALPRKAE